MGDANIASLDLKELGDRFKTAELFGKLANLGDDIGDEFIANASTFRKLVTGDRVNVERKGQDPFEFNNYSKFLFSANVIPRMKDKTGAIQRRLVIVPFDAKFSPDDADFRPYIKDELCEPDAMEYLVILALAGLKRVLTKAKFTTSSRVQNQLEEYEENNNPIIGFVQEIGMDAVENEPSRDVYRKYKEQTKDETKTVIASTASPYKFTRSVMEAMGEDGAMDDFALADALSLLSKVPVPAAVEEIRTAPVLHTKVCDKEEMKAVVKQFLAV